MTKKIERIGFDPGTYSVLAARTVGNEIEIKREINCFYPLQLDEQSKFLVNMIKQSGAPIVEVEDCAYVLGESARQLAISMGKEYHRPMRNGVINANEKQSFNILAVIIRSLIGELTADETIVYYSIPANAINSNTNSDYHQKVIQSILEKYKQGNKIVRAYPINEAMCVIYSELQDKNRTGIGISCGGGQVNAAYSLMGMNLLQFSLVNSGDWIDESSAINCGESVAYINEYKKNIDLSAEPKNAVERSIIYHYQIMIENALKGIADGIIKAGAKANPGGPVDIALAGGTASVVGFVPFFERTLEKVKMPIKIGKVRIGSDPITSVCRGALLCSEAHQD